MKENDILYKSECFEIIGACMDVHNELGKGFLEAVYHEALIIEFEDREIPYESEKPLQLKYKGVSLRKKYNADFLCYNSIIVEIKACNSLDKSHFAQVINYLKATGKKLGLVVNFGANRLEFKRIVL
ncbi:MAG: GxxExxY protein [Bacteroidota bacterium]